MLKKRFSIESYTFLVFRFAIKVTVSNVWSNERKEEEQPTEEVSVLIIIFEEHFLSRACSKKHRI